MAPSTQCVEFCLLFRSQNSAHLLTHLEQRGAALGATFSRGERSQFLRVRLPDFLDLLPLRVGELEISIELPDALGGGLERAARTLARQFASGMGFCDHHSDESEREHGDEEFELGFHGLILWVWTWLSAVHSKTNHTESGYARRGLAHTWGDRHVRAT